LLKGADARRVAELDRKGKELVRSGRIEEALPYAKEIASIRERVQGVRHWQTIDSNLTAQALRRITALSGDERRQWQESVRLNNAASSLFSQGRFVEAEPLGRRALEIRRRVLGEDCRETAASYDNLGASLYGQDRNVEAAPFIRKALEIRERLLGEDHPATAGSYDHLAIHLADRGRMVEAEALMRKSLDINRRALGEDLGTAGSSGRLGLNLIFQFRHAEAEPFLRASLAIYRRLLGEDHLDTAWALANLARLMMQQGQFVEAEPLFRKALEVRRRALGEDHPDTAEGYGFLGSVLTELGRYAEAEPLHRKSLEIKKRTLGEDHSRTADGFYDLATILTNQGRYGEAEPIARKALEIFLRVRGEDYRGTAHGYILLGKILNKLERLADAQALLHRTLEICRRAFGEDSPHTARAFDGLASILMEQGRAEQAEPLYRKALAIMRRVYGEDHSVTSYSEIGLALALFHRGQYPEAERLLRKVVETRRRARGENHVSTIDASENLALALQALGKHSEAELTWRRACQALNRARPRTAYRGIDRAEFTARHCSYQGLATELLRRGRWVEAWTALESGLGRSLLDDLTPPSAMPLSILEGGGDQDPVKRLPRADAPIPAVAIEGRPIPGGGPSREGKHNPPDSRQPESALEGTGGDGTAPGRWFELDRVQASLPEGAALLGWIDLNPSSWDPDLVNEHWACLVRSRSDPVWVRLSGGRAGEAWSNADIAVLQAIHATLSKPPTGSPESWRDPAARAAERVLGPLVRHLDGRDGRPPVHHLVVLPSPYLRAIPLEALLSAWSNAPPGLKVSYAPSGTLFAWLQERRKDAHSRGRPASPPRLLALGDPDFEVRPPPPAPPDHGVLVLLAQYGGRTRGRIEPGDVILQYNGVEIRGSDQLANIIRDMAAASRPGTARESPRPEVATWREGRIHQFLLDPHPIRMTFDRRSAAEAIGAWRESIRLVRGSRGASLAPLPGTRREVEAVAALFDQSTVLLGPDATEAELERRASHGELRRYDMLLLATHGVANRRVAMESQLFLARGKPRPGGEVDVSDDGVLTAAQMIGWKLDADLVTISACESGLGRFADGEGFLGFAQALFLARSRTVVLSLWKVDDRATALLMTRFHQNLLGRRGGLDHPMPKAEALDEAKQWLRNLTEDEVGQDPIAMARGEIRKLKAAEPAGKTVEASREAGARKPYEHPHYWAAFVLMGDPF
jgi:tetratricopeptide (TPR) repeat protein